MSKTKLAASLFVASCFFCSQTYSNESVTAEQTAPESAVHIPTPVDKAATPPEPEKPVLFKDLYKALRNAPPFFRDSSLAFNFRAYSFDEENTDDTQDFANSLGGELAFVTGRFLKIARIGLSYYVSEPVGDSQNAGDTGLVASDGDGLDVLGQAYLELGRPGGLQGALGRRGYRIPYLDTDDSRMIPRTQEALVFGRTGTRRDFGIGHFTKTKPKDSEEFISMSEAAGASGTDEGVSAAWGIFSLKDSATLGVFNLYGWDTYNTLYIEGNWASYLLRKLGTKVGAQYTDQRSVGDALVGDFNTWQAGLKWAGSVKSAVLTLAHTQTGTGGSINHPWGGLPSYNWMMIQSFNRPGERAWRLTASLTGTPWNVNAWSGFVSIVHGYDALDATTGLPAPDVSEVDLTIDYRPTTGRIKGLWVRLRGAYAEFDDGSNEWNTRLIVNYSMPML